MDQPTIRELLESSDNSKYMMFSFVSKIILNLYGVWVCSNSETAWDVLWQKKKNYVSFVKSIGSQAENPER